MNGANVPSDYSTSKTNIRFIIEKL